MSALETIRDSHRVYRLDDLTAQFGNGLLVTNLTGPDRFTFDGPFGATTVTLDVPYCSSCDEPIPSSGICEGCELFHADLVEPDPSEVRDLGDGRWGVAA